VSAAERLIRIVAAVIRGAGRDRGTAPVARLSREHVLPLR